MRKQTNQKKYSPIPLLAFHIAIFNGIDAKHALAQARASLADKLYAISQIKRRERV